MIAVPERRALTYTANVTIVELIILLVLGFSAGVLGGMLGVGGSIIMIPVLTLLLGKNQQLSQAAAMIINACIAIAAVQRHQRVRAVRWDFWRRMIPAGFVFIVIGVTVSNIINHSMLERLFGLFLVYVICINIRILLGRGKPQVDGQCHAGWLSASIIGSIMGFTAGLLGIGGGIIAVPLIQRLTKLPLRQCIATSAAVMCVTSIVGAATKNISLPTLAEDGVNLNLNYIDSLIIAACLIPTAILGGVIGAGFTHTLSLKWIRLTLILLLVAACAKYLGLV